MTFFKLSPKWVIQKGVQRDFQKNDWFVFFQRSFLSHFQLPNVQNASSNSQMIRIRLSALSALFIITYKYFLPNINKNDRAIHIASHPIMSLVFFFASFMHIQSILNTTKKSFFCFFLGLVHNMLRDYSVLFCLILLRHFLQSEDLFFCFDFRFSRLKWKVGVILIQKNQNLWWNFCVLEDFE